MMAPIKSHIPMNLRNNKLKYSLLGLSLFGLPVQEAILHNQLVLGFCISQDSFSVCYLQKGFLKGLLRGLSMLDHLVEDWVLLLFKLPIGNIGGGQPSWSCTNSYLLAGFLVIRIRPHSLFSPICQRHNSIVQGSLDPWVWDLV